MSFAETFKALSDPARREILLLLRDGRMSAGVKRNLEKLLNSPPSAFGLPVSRTAGSKQNALSDCRQKAILPPKGGE